MPEKSAFDLQDFLPYLLNEAAEASSLSFQRAYRDRYGMLRTEWRVLFHLGLYGRLTATDIGQRSRMHKTKISRAVSALEAKRFLTRSRDATDRRAEFLTLTAAGEAAYRDLSAIARAHDAALVAALPPDLAGDQAAMLRAALKRLAGRA